MFNFKKKKPPFKYVEGELVATGAYDGVEWSYTTGDFIDHGTEKAMCDVCHARHLRYQFRLRAKNGKAPDLWCGSTCVKQFAGGALTTGILERDRRNKGKWQALEKKRLDRIAKEEEDQKFREEQTRKYEAHIAGLRAQARALQAQVESEHREMTPEEHAKWWDLEFGV
jgi:hypothetical protein